MAFLAAWAALLLVVYPAVAQEKVKVSVFYETKCPDSRNFIVSQLYPVWTDLSDIITLDVNCYGRSKEMPRPGGGYDFECQHGPVECEGNTMMTCAKKYILSQHQLMAFTSCVMDEFVGAAAGPKCAEGAGVNFTPILECYSSVEGELQQHLVGLQQAALDDHPIFIPDVFVNGHLLGGRDLRTAVCQAYTGLPPLPCDL